MNLTIKVDWTWLVLLAIPLAMFAGGMDGCTLPGVLTPSGPRTVLIVREASDSTSETARTLTTALRTGEPAKYIAAKGHSLLILDDDSKDENGQPSPVLAKFAPFAVPELLIIAGDKAIHREKCPATADGVLAVLKAKGG